MYHERYLNKSPLPKFYPAFLREILRIDFRFPKRYVYADEISSGLFPGKVSFESLGSSVRVIKFKDGNQPCNPK